MIEKEVVVESNKGLQSRNVALLVKKAMNFQSNITITYNRKRADAKSLINVIALKVPQKAIITITVSGRDERLAIEEISELLYSLN